MKKTYTALEFNGTRITGLINVSLESDLYSESLRGSRTLLEEKIPGRDLPYFYGVDDQPLTFDITLALDTPSTKLEIKNLVKSLLSHKTYKTLRFGYIDNNVFIAQTAYYKVIFINDSLIDYIGTKDNEFLGYLTLSARCDRPYGYSLHSFPATGNFTSISDVDNVPVKITMKNETVAAIANPSVTLNGVILQFGTIGAGETIVFDGFRKIITPNTAYSSWNRLSPIINSGTNTFSKTTNLTVQIEYEAPIYIKE